eukprot:7518462-Alexandrium_andersonii.AAC.1
MVAVVTIIYHCCMQGMLLTTVLMASRERVQPRGVHPAPPFSLSLQRTAGAPRALSSGVLCSAA